MSRTIVGAGAHGAIARAVQTALVTAGWMDSADVDGWYGAGTAAAVAAHQRARALPSTGIVDTGTWSSLLPSTPVPSLAERCLTLTAAFEGHDYTLAVGDFDGAWLTWGIIGFTLKHGAVARLILEVERESPALLRRAFGAESEQLLRVMQARPAEQQRWAASVTVRGGLLAEPWRTGFDLLGRCPEVQKIQRGIAETQYFVPALETARRMALDTELGVALCFDIHVQNGGISRRALSLLGEDPPREQRARRVAIAHAVADCARPQYREDVRARKLCIAEGEGRVHGARYALRNWGIDEFPAEVRLAKTATAGQ